MQVSLQVDPSEVTNGLRYMADSIPKAMTRALRMTARDAQTNIRQGIDTRFTVTPSRQQFVHRLIKITPEKASGGGKVPGTWLSVAAPAASANDPTDEKRIRGMLTRHEEGGTQNAKENPFFIPTPKLRPSPTTQVPIGLYPVNLRLADRKNVDGSTLAGLKRGKVKTLEGKNISNRGRKKAGMEGLLGTFRIDAPELSRSGIYRRVGRDRKQIEKIWSFRRKVQLKPRLQFMATIERTVTERWKANAAVAVDEVIQAAMKRGAKNLAAGVLDELSGGLL